VCEALKIGGIESSILDTKSGLHHTHTIEFGKKIEPALFWTRRVYDPVFTELEKKEDDFEFMQREKIFFRDNMIAYLETSENISWVNRPSKLFFAENKSVQIQNALNQNILVPKTIFGSTRRNYLRKITTGDNLVIKPFEGYTWINKDTTSLSALAERISSADFEKLVDDSSAYTPSIHQEEIKKMSDIRIYVVGNEIFPVRLIKNKKIYDHIDIRAYFGIPNTFEFEFFQLKEKDKNKIFSFVQSMSIDMASMDFVETESGDLYFLDLNPGGAWLYLEEMIPSLCLLQETCYFFSKRLGLDSIKKENFPSLEIFMNSSVAKTFVENRYPSTSKDWSLRSRKYV